MAVLKANKRETFGTRKLKPLRKQGQIPGIVYGHGQPPLPVALSLHDVGVALAHGERLLELDVEGKIQNVLVKEVQYDPMGQEILHVDLARVDLDERVKVTVPIVLRGTPAGAAEGGVLHQVTAQATIECTVRSIPEDLRMSVAEMKIGDVLQMKNLTLPEDAKLVSDAETIVATVSIVKEEVVAPAAAAVEAAVAEPEVIGEKKEEPEEEEKKETKKEAKKEEGKKEAAEG
jgi:large subunit ribosomal protein L25